MVETVSLLDLYEGSVADINPFLNRRRDSHSQPPSVSVNEISALLLDHLSSASATAFIEKAKSSGMITKSESAELSAIIGLADPAINDGGSDGSLLDMMYGRLPMIGKRGGPGGNLLGFFVPL